MFTLYDFCIPKNTQNFWQSSEEDTATSEFAGVLYGYILRLKFPTKMLASFAPDTSKYIWGHWNTQKSSQVSKNGCDIGKICLYSL